MPLLLPLLIGAGLFVLYTRSKKGEVTENKSGISVVGPQYLSAVEKFALLASLPLRNVANPQSLPNAEVVDLLDEGVAGSAKAVDIVAGANLKDGHYVLVGKPVGQNTQLLVPSDNALAEQFAKQGSPWKIFLSPGEAKDLAGTIPALPPPGMKKLGDNLLAAAAGRQFPTAEEVARNTAAGLRYPTAEEVAAGASPDIPLLPSNTPESFNRAARMALPASPLSPFRKF